MNPEANRKYMTSFDVKIIKGAGHFVMLERPEEFNRLLEESIEEITKEANPKPEIRNTKQIQMTKKRKF
jgi:hypothetical protein